MDKIKVRSATASTYSFYRVYDLRASPLGSKVVPGGFIIIDDWELGGCRKAINDFFLLNEMHQV